MASQSSRLQATWEVLIKIEPFNKQKAFLNQIETYIEENKNNGL